MWKLLANIVGFVYPKEYPPSLLARCISQLLYLWLVVKVLAKTLKLQAYIQNLVETMALPS